MNGKPEGGARTTAPPLEWAAAAVGLALLVAIIGYLAYFALTSPVDVPAVTVQSQGVGRSGESYVVVAEVRNRSGAAAASLEIRGELRRDGAVIEASEATLDYLPPSSTRRVGLFFRNDPEGYALSLFPTGYIEP